MVGLGPPARERQDPLRLEFAQIPDERLSRVEIVFRERKRARGYRGPGIHQSELDDAEAVGAFLQGRTALAYDQMNPCVCVRREASDRFHDGRIYLDREDLPRMEVLSADDVASPTGSDDGDIERLRRERIANVRDVLGNVLRHVVAGLRAQTGQDGRVGA